MKNYIKKLYVALKLNIIRSIISVTIYRTIRKFSGTSLKKPFNTETIIFQKTNKHTFFGYYDIDPISKNDNFALVMVVPSDNRKMQKATIGYFNINKANSFQEIGETETWCWQQGCRLRWSKVDEDLIFYNKILQNQYGSVCQNIYDKKIVLTINHPIYDVNRGEKYGLSLNFSRLQRLRPGYGYEVFADSSIGSNSPGDDGVFIIDLKKNSSELIISLKELSSFAPCETMINCQHYVNHLSFNPTGNRFLFFHLWTDGTFRKSRLFTSDISGKNLCLLENKENVSHYYWKNDREIIITTHSVKHGSRYSIYKDESKMKRLLSPSILNEDGHPSFCPLNHDIILSDTYPDKYGERSLFIFDTKTKEKKILDNFKSPIKYRGEYRCDLHPRWSSSGNIISFDSTHQNGLRSFNILKGNFFEK